MKGLWPALAGKDLNVDKSRAADQGLSYAFMAGRFIDMERFWGLDIGGTKCALVSGTRNCEMDYRREVPTRSFENWQQLLQSLFANAPDERPSAIGISC